MVRIWFFTFLFLGTGEGFLSTAQAEPWLANRYAQNCASCHSPGRREVEARDRRCTITCQSCHANPNGGGIRNEYGVWNQQRWLRSAKSDRFRSKGTPAPLKFQKYFHPAGEKPDATASTHLAKKGAPLVVVPGTTWAAADYARSADSASSAKTDNRADFLSRITEDDPYRLERERTVFAGGDFRYMFLDMNKKVGGTVDPDIKDSSTFARALDLGVRVKPMGEHLAVVLEHRYLQEPTDSTNDSTQPENQSSLEKIFNSTSAVRSAYVMVDDLPWNSFMMYGLYKPLFGLTGPDHTSLLNNMRYANNLNSGGNDYNEFQSTSAFGVQKAFTFGAAPGVPFANVHWIMPTDQEFDSNPFSQERGFAANLGLNFRKLGATLMGSWWSTEGPREDGGLNLKNQMISVNGGLTIRNLILNFDYTGIEREFDSTGEFDKGSVSTLEAKYRVWREVYAILNYSAANTARNLKRGKASEMSYGLKSFLYPGTEFEVLMINREDQNDDTNLTTSTTALQAQAHIFF